MAVISAQSLVSFFLRVETIFKETSTFAFIFTSFILKKISIRCPAITEIFSPSTFCRKITLSFFLQQIVHLPNFEIFSFLAHVFQYKINFSKKAYLSFWEIYRHNCIRGTFPAFWWSKKIPWPKVHDFWFSCNSQEKVNIRTRWVCGFPSIFKYGRK